MLRNALAVLLLVVLAVKPAHAICAASDIAGQWQGYLMFDFDGGQAWYRCPLTIEMARNGFEIRPSSCAASWFVGRSQMKNGAISIDTECNVRAEFTIDRAFKVISATMALSKDTVHGVGIYSFDRQHYGFSFTMVRR